MKNLLERFSIGREKWGRKRGRARHRWLEKEKATGRQALEKEAGEEQKWERTPLFFIVRDGKISKF